MAGEHRDTSFFDAIKEKVDLEDYLAKHLNVELVHGSSGMMNAICPFHEEDTPSFVLYEERDRPWKTWHCYGACGEGGTVLDAVMKSEGLDVFEAAEFLNDLYDLGLERDSKAYEHFKKTREETRAAVEKAQEEIESKESRAGIQARQYLHNRGYSDAAIKEFGLGVDVSQTKAGRLSIPIHDRMGQPVSVANRALFDEAPCRVCHEPVKAKEMRKRFFQWKKAEERGEKPPFLEWEACPHCGAPGKNARLSWLTRQDPKYLFLRDFDKARYLYNENRARAPLLKDPEGELLGLIIAEGYPDVWAAWEGGQVGACAYSGSVLSDEQAKAAVDLAKMARKPIILCPDFDETGQGRLNAGSGVGANIHKLRAVDPTIEIQVVYGIDKLTYKQGERERRCKDLGEVLEHYGPEIVANIIRDNRWPAAEWQIRQIISAPHLKNGQPFYSKDEEMRLIAEILHEAHTRQSLDHLIPVLSEHWNLREEQTRQLFYSNLPPEEQTSAKHLFKTIEQAQEEAVLFVSPENVIPLGFKDLDECFMGGGVRHGQLMMILGKSQPLNAKILTPQGWKRMGDMQVNDEVIDPATGGVARVKSVHPQGRRQMYRVSFSDGASTECDGEHLWQVQQSDRGCAWEVFTTLELRERMAVSGTRVTNFIPMTVPVRFSCTEELPVSPYLLGAFVGDRFSDDHSVRSACAERSPVVLSTSSPVNVNDEVWHGKRFRASIDELEHSVLKKGLEKLGERRSIPEAYRFALPEERLELLRGLIDAGGRVNTVKEHNENSFLDIIEFCSPFRELAEDVRFLVQSLGGTAKILKASYGLSGGERGERRIKYFVRINMPPHLNPFTLSKKREHFTRQSAPCRYIVSITPSKIEEAQCIALDSESQLYMTNDFIVTHNSGTGKAQPLDAKVLTPQGWKLMADIQVDDEVVNPDGGTAKVVGVFPQGERDIYRVTFNDGSSTECDLEHLWYVHDGDGRWKVCPLKDIVEEINGETASYYIPLVKAPDFNGRGERGIAPYFLGTLIGNMSLSNIFCINKKILQGVLPENVGTCEFRDDDSQEKCEAEHLLTLAQIPDSYLWAPAQERLELLRGLMDTGGEVCTSEGVEPVAEFYTSFLRMAEDVLSLVHSLGGTARIETIRGDTDGKHAECREYLCVRFSLTMNPFHVPHKAELFQRCTTPVRRMCAVDLVGRKKAQCIMLDSTNQLYVTDDFIVSHNTMMASQFLANMADRDINCLFLSLEQGAGSFFPRLACQALDRAPIEVENMIKENDPELERVRELYRNMLIVDNVPTETVEAVSMSPGKVKSIINEANLVHFEGKPIDVVIIDHLGILEVGPEAPADIRKSEAAAPGWIMKELFRVCKETRTFFVVLQQLPKEVKAGVPFAMDAGWGGSQQTNFCDYILQIWRPEQAEGLKDEERREVAGQYKVALGKNRFGKGALLNYIFDDTTLRILPPLKVSQPKADLLEDGEMLFISPEEEQESTTGTEVGATVEGLRELAERTGEGIPRDTQALLDALGMAEEEAEVDAHEDDPFAEIEFEKSPEGDKDTETSEEDADDLFDIG